MTTLSPLLPRDRPAEILFLGAHSDDIEIGCGATVLGIVSELRDVNVHWVVFSADGRREEEARSSAAAFLSGVPESRIHLDVRGFRNAFFPAYFAEIKESFEELKRRVSPDLIFTHHREDLHQDHRVLGELTWNTYRDHTILEYEIPKYDGGLAEPNAFVPAAGETWSRKIDLLLEHFRSQADKHWFRRELFAGVMRLRGLESCAPGGYAEAFVCRKATLSWGHGRDAG